MKKVILYIALFICHLASLQNTFAENTEGSASISIIGAIDATNSCSTTMTPTHNPPSHTYARTNANIQCTYPTSVQVRYQSAAGILINPDDVNQETIMLSPQKIKVRAHTEKNLSFIVNETPKTTKKESTYAISSLGGDISIVDHEKQYIAKKKYDIPLSIASNQPSENYNNQSHIVTIELYFL